MRKIFRFELFLVSGCFSDRKVVPGGSYFSDGSFSGNSFFSLSGLMKVFSN